MQFFVVNLILFSIFKKINLSLSCGFFILQQLCLWNSPKQIFSCAVDTKRVGELLDSESTVSLTFHCSPKYLQNKGERVGLNVRA